MKSSASWLRLGFVFMIFISARVSGLATSRVSPAQPQKAISCGAPENREFDFWAGDWDVFSVGNPLQEAHAQVDLILDSCALREDYQGRNGHSGQSLTVYDGTKKVWHQSWVTNQGELLVIEGKMQAGEMVLSGEDLAKGLLVRGTWRPDQGNVRETAVTSADGGKTWQPWFDLLFRRSTTVMDKTRASASGDPNDDQKIVAALDMQYQAAVKKNATDTIARILADDFVLVTGSGKTYTKADLLADARSGKTTYQQNDDDFQKVRVWGDTAVITAKLWEKGATDGTSFDRKFWFSDTYVRTPTGWSYVFGQSSLPLPGGAQ